MHVSLLEQKCHSLFFHLVLLLTPSYVTHITHITSASKPAEYAHNVWPTLGLMRRSQAGTI